MIKLSWGISLLEKVNVELDNSPESFYVSPNYLLNPDAYDGYLVYMMTLDEIKYVANPIPLYQVIIWSAMGGYILHEVVD